MQTSRLLVATRVASLTVPFGYTKLLTRQYSPQGSEYRDAIKLMKSQKFILLKILQH